MRQDSRDSVRDRQSWLQYTHDPGKSARMGIHSARPVFSVQNPSGTYPIKSMLTLYEASVLYMLAKDYYRGNGEIVDLGPLAGLSTNALARGLKYNRTLAPEDKRRRIHSFDLFLTQGYSHFFDPEEIPVSGSIFMNYLDANRDFLDLISINPGDLLSHTWRELPIEILFIDIAKSWELNSFIVDTMFPWMIPGETIVVQQDYVHYYEYWIHITMEYFAEYFELLYMTYGATAVFRYEKRIPQELLKTDLQSLDIAAKNRLLLSARAKAPESAREVMKTAHAKCLAEHQCFDEAIELLQSVDFEAKTDDPTLNFSGVARDNAAKVNEMLVTLCGRGAFPA